MSRNEEARKKKQDEDREDRALRRRVEKEKKSRETREREAELKEKERNWNSPRPHWRPKSQNEDSRRSQSPKQQSLSEGDAALPLSSRSLSSSSSQTEDEEEGRVQQEVIDLDTPSSSDTPRRINPPAAPVKESFLELLQKQSVRPLPKAWVRRNQPSQPTLEDLLQEEITRIEDLFEPPSPQDTNEDKDVLEEITEVSEEPRTETALEEFEQGINPWSSKELEELPLDKKLEEEVILENTGSQKGEEHPTRIEVEDKEVLPEEEDLDISLLYQEETPEYGTTPSQVEESSSEEDEHEVPAVNVLTSSTNQVLPDPSVLVTLPVVPTSNLQPLTTSFPSNTSSLSTSRIFGSLRKVLQTVPQSTTVNPVNMTSAPYTRQNYPKFRGKTHDDADDFIDLFETLAVTNKEGQDADKLRVFPGLLRKTAQSWLSHAQKSRPADVDTWDKLKKEFLKRFRTLDYKHTVLKKLSALKRKKN
ncbi:hypothetical protein R1sor_003368 [Riccia sorocarpa]|uniref:Retrotransposon gag domain-containing protein n=1 Tax=Riccia sorocarpa TaxID=122646 RepID=A0ABD3H5I6_9MARC